MLIKKQQLIDEDSLLVFFDYLKNNMPKGLGEMSSEDLNERNFLYRAIDKRLVDAITEFGSSVAKKLWQIRKN